MSGRSATNAPAVTDVTATPGEPDDPDHLDDEVVVRLGTAWRELRRGAAASGIRHLLYADLPVQLEQGQADTLFLLVQHDELRMREVADGLRVDRSTATRAVDRLVDIGLAERAAASADGRGVVVRVSERGAELYAELVGRYRALMHDVLDAFEPDEQLQLVELFERMVARVDELVGDRTVDP